MTGEIKRTLYDLSRPIASTTPVWPGDTPFVSEWMSRIGGSGFAVNLSTIRTTVHLGAHADAPLHTEVDGVSIDQMDPDVYLGRCRVVECPVDRGPSHLVEIADIAAELGRELPPRVLIKTGANWDGGFPTAFAGLAPELADTLHARGVRLVGTDAPSVDPFDSTELRAHHALLGRGIAVLESLRLGPVPPGDYELIALPLPLVGLDASPVRAVLRAFEESS